MIKYFNLDSLTETESVAADFAKKVAPPCLIYLEGELGAGKTAFVRGFLNGLGYTGVVKSPTFTLVETYHFKAMTVAHFDLYRMDSVEELEAIGFRDYLNDESVCLIEWPQKAAGYLPAPDILCTLKQGVDINSRRLSVASDLKWLARMNGFNSQC